MGYTQIIGNNQRVYGKLVPISGKIYPCFLNPSRFAYVLGSLGNDIKYLFDNSNCPIAYSGGGSYQYRLGYVVICTEESTSTQTYDSQSYTYCTGTYDPTITHDYIYFHFYVYDWVIDASTGYTLQKYYYKDSPLLSIKVSRCKISRVLKISSSGALNTTDQWFNYYNGKNYGESYWVYNNAITLYFNNGTDKNPNWIELGSKSQWSNTWSSFSKYVTFAGEYTTDELTLTYDASKTDSPYYVSTTGNHQFKNCNNCSAVVFILSCDNRIAPETAISGLSAAYPVGTTVNCNIYDPSTGTISGNYFYGKVKTATDSYIQLDASTVMLHKDTIAINESDFKILRYVDEGGSVSGASSSWTKTAQGGFTNTVKLQAISSNPARYEPFTMSGNISASITGYTSSDPNAVFTFLIWYTYAGSSSYLHYQTYPISGNSISGTFSYDITLPTYYDYTRVTLYYAGYVSTSSTVYSYSFDMTVSGISIKYTCDSVAVQNNDGQMKNCVGSWQYLSVTPTS